MDDSSIINAFKHMKLPLMIVGSDGTIVHCNSGTDRLFGYDHGELIGRPAFVVLPVSSVKELNAFIKAPATDATIKNMVGWKQSGNSVATGNSPDSVDRGENRAAARLGPS